MLNPKMEKTLQKISPEYLFYKGDELKEYIALDNLQSLMNFDESLSPEDLGPIRKAARKRGGTDMIDVMDDFKAGLLFINSFYKLILKENPNVEKRQEQIRGSKYIFMSSYFKSTMTGEYPTGSGKSFMYLISACAAYFLRGEYSTVVTSGISLQEQLESKDMPFIADVYTRLTGEYIMHGIIKGRQNYICQVKLEIAEYAIHKKASVAGVKDMDYLKEFIKQIPKPFNGDISNVSVVPDSSIIKALTVKDSREGGCNSCISKDTCYFFMHRKNIMMSALKVVNYHLLFTEIDNIGVLGALSGMANQYIFDEAHEIARIGRDFSEQKFHKGSIQGIKSALTFADNKMFEMLSIKSPAFGEISGSRIDYILEELEMEFSTSIPTSYSHRKTKWYTDVIIEPDDFLDVRAMVQLLRELNEVIDDAILHKVEKCGFSSPESMFGASQEDGVFEPEMQIIDTYISITETIWKYIKLLKLFSEEFSTKEKRKEKIIWISKDHTTDRLALVSKSIVVESVNKAIFENDDLSSVCVSATLSTNNNFDFFMKEVRLDKSNVSYQVISPSPFDLKTQELWYLPNESASASKSDTDEETYNKLVVDNISKVLSISKGGMLALFTSYRAMEHAYSEIRRKHLDLNIFIQGDKPRKRLIDDFYNDINSVLFGTKSFFTGIDIQGPSLRVLVIDKLPFDNPSDPVTRTLSSGVSGFYDYSVPNMIMTLKQIIGRGVRSKKDKCLIVFLDRRLKASNYASTIHRTFKSSQNHSSRTMSIDRVETFMRDILDDYNI